MRGSFSRVTWFWSILISRHHSTWLAIPYTIACRTTKRPYSGNHVLGRNQQNFVQSRNRPIAKFRYISFLRIVQIAKNPSFWYVSYIGICCGSCLQEDDEVRINCTKQKANYTIFLRSWGLPDNFLARWSKRNQAMKYRSTIRILAMVQESCACFFLPVT